MAKRSTKPQPEPRYRDAGLPDVDLDAEDVRDARGNRITGAYVEAAVARGHEHFDRVGRTVGRPSLSGSGVSKLRAIRVPNEMDSAIEALARRQRRRPSALIREAVEQYLVSEGAWEK